MKLLYVGKNGAFINGVPARDLEPEEVQGIAEQWDLSLAETEGLLIKRGMYKAEKQSANEAAKLHKPQYPKDSKKQESE